MKVAIYSRKSKFTGKGDSIENQVQLCTEYAKNLGVTDKSKAIMIGDRHYDIEGAKKVSLEAIGVTFGYGTREELESAGAIAVVDTPKELSELF